MSVSRETPPAAPAVAAGVFSHPDVAEAYATLLADAGVTRGLIGPREVPRLWERHLINCALLARALPHGAAVADIGSGAGLPGLVVAGERPDLRLTLVEPLLRRTRFLEEAVGVLDLANVEVVRARAEDLHGRREFDVVTSRAVAPLERLLPWSLPLVRSGGDMIAMKGASVHEELERVRDRLPQWGAGDVRVEVFGAGEVDPPTTVVRVHVASRPEPGSGEPRAWIDRRRAGRRRPARGRRGNADSGARRAAENEGG